MQEWGTNIRRKSGAGLGSIVKSGASTVSALTWGSKFGAKFGEATNAWLSALEGPKPETPEWEKADTMESTIPTDEENNLAGQTAAGRKPDTPLQRMPLQIWPAETGVMVTLYLACKVRRLLTL